MILSVKERLFRRLRKVVARATYQIRPPLPIGIIGYGGIAPDHVDAYEMSGLARVIGVSDLLPANLARALDRWPSVRAFQEYRRMLAEVGPAVVSICTWPQSHAEIVEAAAASGVRAILCEKPLALCLIDLDRMREACRKSGTLLAGGHQYRFHRTFLAAAELIKAGEIGEVKKVQGQIKSTLANNGPHLIDTVRFVLGDPRAVSAQCTCWRERNEVNRGLPSEDSAEGQITFENGVLFELATGDRASEFFSLEISGSRGKIRVSPSALRMNDQDCTPSRSTADDCRARQFKQFLQWTKGQVGAYTAEFEQGAQTAELVLSLYESARTQKRVDLPLKNRGDVIGQLYPTHQAVPVSDEQVELSSTGGQTRLAIDGGPRAVKNWFSLSPKMGAAELFGLARVIRSRSLSCTDGTMVPALEREFASLYGCKHAVASTSGTAAIHVALAALGLNPGDEVITTPMTDMGTVIPILACNCMPVFADIDPITGNLTAESILDRITPRTRAVILVHLFGFPAELSRISQVLKERGISLIEDCSQAHFAEYDGKKVGTIGDFGTFSFQQSKQITCGDGGMTLVNRADLAERASLFVDKGWDRKRGVRAHLFLGMNYRMTELQGAVCRAQIRRLPALIANRRRMAEDLSKRIREIRGLVPPPSEEGVNPSWWMYPFGIDEELMGLDSESFAGALCVEGVKVRRSYLPVPIFEYDVLKHHRTYGDSGYPFSEYPHKTPQVEDYPGLKEFGRRLLFINWSHNVRRRHVDGIVTAVRKVVTSAQETRRCIPSTAKNEAPVLS